MTDLKPSEVLEAAAKLIEPEGAWTQGAFSRWADGTAVWHPDSDSVCYCAAGAVKQVARNNIDRAILAWHYVERAIDGNIANWNDHPDRTQAEVVQALRDAAALARSAGK